MNVFQNVPLRDPAIQMKFFFKDTDVSMLVFTTLNQPKPEKRFYMLNFFASSISLNMFGEVNLNVLKRKRVIIPETF